MMWTGSLPISASAWASGMMRSSRPQIELDRHAQICGDHGVADTLGAARKPFRGNRLERRGDPVEPLVAQRILDHRPADHRRIVHQQRQHFLHLAAALRAHEAVDERGIDLGPELRRCDQGQARHPVGLPACEFQGNSAAHRVPDEVGALDAERRERTVDDGSKAGLVGAVQHLGRAAMAGQVERHCAPALGQRRLGEHPAVEIGAEAVHQHDRRFLAAAEIEHAQPLAAGLDVARRQRAVFRRVRHGRLGHDESGDKRVDLGVGHALRRRHREERPDRQCRPRGRDDAA